MVVTDGAFKFDGRYGATAGIGVELGEYTKFRFPKPIIDRMNPGQKRRGEGV